MSHNHNHSHDGGAKNIKTALFLNLSFTIIEIIGGLFTNSLAILSDALHDFGDSIVLIVSYLSTKLAKKKPTAKHTFGFKRASLFAALLAGVVLLGGSIFIIVNAFSRLFEPQEVHSIGMIALAIVGVLVNGFAMLKTRKGKSQNEKIVSWHMMEDVLNWVAVLIGGIVIQITGWHIIDPILTIGFAAFIIVGTCKNLIGTFKIFMESVPEDISVDEVKEAILKIKGVADIHDIHIWSLDGETNVMTAHIVTTKKVGNAAKIREEIKQILKKLHIIHTTLEFEQSGECENCCSLSH